MHQPPEPVRTARPYGDDKGSIAPFSSGIATGLWIAAVAGFIAPMFLRRFLAKPAPVAE